MPTINGVMETALYVEDTARSAAFYQRVFGFAVLVQSERLSALAVREGQVLLLFKKGATPEDIVTPEGVIPAHDGDGQLHFALAIDAEAYALWSEQLAVLEIPLVSEVHWGRGGKSLYFRDPDGHLIELGTPGIWANY